MWYQRATITSAYGYHAIKLCSTINHQKALKVVNASSYSKGGGLCLLKDSPLR